MLNKIRQNKIRHGFVEKIKIPTISGRGLGNFFGGAEERIKPSDEEGSSRWLLYPKCKGDRESCGPGTWLPGELL